MTVLSESMHHVYAWCPQRLEEGVRPIVFLEFELHVFVVLGTELGSLAKAACLRDRDH